MKVFLSGDVMTGRGIDQILKHPVAPRIYEGYLKDARSYVTLAEGKHGKIPREVGDDYIWGDALSIWKRRNPDLKIINLETAVSAGQTFFPKWINYHMHPDNISVLSAAGIDICVLANNHVLDWSYAGLKDTISALDRVQIKHSGAGATLEEAQAPAIFENKNGRVLVFSLSHTSSGVPAEWSATHKRAGVFLLRALDDESLQIVRTVIEKYKKADDVVIVSIHWGSNWGYDIASTDIDFAHGLIDLAGVNIVHGHSSHHPRPMEIYNGCPIFYGCGDFINDYEGIGGNEEYRDDLALAYFVSFETRPFKLERIDFDCLKINRFQLHRATLEDTNWMRETLDRICRPFALKFSQSEENYFFLRFI